jgi:peptide/nickel transport system ATP-binding protein
MNKEEPKTTQTTDNEHITQDSVLLKIQNLKVQFKSQSKNNIGVKGKVEIISDVSFDLKEGQILGIVGESGCGKSTLAKTIVQINKQTDGTIHFNGNDIASLNKSELKKLKQQIQMIFQDPISSLNPTKTVLSIVSEPYKVHKIKYSKDEIISLLATVGLDSNNIIYRKPKEFSGGQCQRISIARALSLKPKLLICDEPVSALDVSIQAQILNLLLQIRSEFNMSIIFITHDLSVVKYIADKIAVMYLGKICEIGQADTVISNPAHPYTQILINSVLKTTPDDSNTQSTTDISQGATYIKGEVPTFLNPPLGCRFSHRCPYSQPICEIEQPTLKPSVKDGLVACHFPLNQTSLANTTKTNIGEVSEPN